jgi:hypothetical protein
MTGLLAGALTDAAGLDDRQACLARGTRRHRRRRSARVRVATAEVPKPSSSGCAAMACGGRVGGRGRLGSRTPASPGPPRRRAKGMCRQTRTSHRFRPVRGSRGVMPSRYTAFCSFASCCPALAPRGRTTITRPQSVQPQPMHAGSSQYVEIIKITSLRCQCRCRCRYRHRHWCRWRVATSLGPDRDRPAPEWRSACQLAGRAVRSAG